MAGTQAPIGIFDSGVGGLTVLKAIRAALPEEDLLYLGDTARTPYGIKAGETVTRFTLEGVAYLANQGIKALVVACNTASAFALPALHRKFSFPILDVIRPGARTALRVCDDKHPIGIIGTRATIQSGAYRKTLQRLQSSCRVVSQACPLLVPLVEEGWLTQAVTQTVMETYLRPLLNRGIRSLILGCTHYPALKPMIGKVCGSGVRIIDSAEEVAKELKSVLLASDLRARGRRRRGKQVFWVTDVPNQFLRVGKMILNRPLGVVRRVELAKG